MRFPASIISVLATLLALPTWTVTTRSHPDGFIGYFARVLSSDPRIYEPSKLLPPIVVSIEIGVVMCFRRRFRRRGRARIRCGGWYRGGSHGALPPVLNRGQYAFSVGHGRIGFD